MGGLCKNCNLGRRLCLTGKIRLFLRRSRLNGLPNGKLFPARRVFFLPKLYELGTFKQQAVGLVWFRAAHTHPSLPAA